MKTSGKTTGKTAHGWRVISLCLTLFVLLSQGITVQATISGTGPASGHNPASPRPESSLYLPPVALDDGGTGFITQENQILITPNVLLNDSDPDGDLIAISNLDTSETLGLLSPLDGRLDPTFDGDGKIITNINWIDRARALAVQSDGRLILVGETTSGNYNFAVLRYNTNGTLDSSFDGDGIAITDFGWTDVPYGVAIQPDQKIVVGGYANENIGVARYNPNGSPDTSFSEDGKATTTGIIVHEFNGMGLALHPDGKIVVVGTCWDDNIGYAIIVTRFTAGGELDHTFGNAGMVIAGFGDMSSAHDVVIQPDNNILISGYGRDDSEGKEGILLVRYDPDGDLDRDFGNNGSVLTHIGYTNFSSQGVALAMQPDNKFLVTGNSSDFFVLARYEQDGELDSSFDEDGLILTDSILSKDVVVQPNGKILVAGTMGGSTTGDDMQVHRFNPDGSLDATFGDGGISVINFGQDYAYATALGPGGVIYVAGNVSTDIALARLVGDGVFTYNPNQQFDYLKTGELAYDTFTYTVTDGDLSDTADVTITIVGGMELAYLPLVVLPPDIYGLVTENGVPAAGIPLALRFFDGAAWSTLATTVTNDAGKYAFTNLPSLAPGQVYYVRYLNETNPTRLGVWMTREVTSFTGSSSVNIGNFDIANIELLLPFPGDEVSLPYTFQWSARLASLADSYEFNLFDPVDGNPYFYTAPPLGYVSSYALRDLPSGFEYGVDYAWDIWVYSPEGGTGVSYWAYIVSFSDTNLGEATGVLKRMPHTIVDLEAWRDR